MAMLLSKIELRRSDPARKALAAQLAKGASADGGHALIAMLFPESTSRTFLWREDRGSARFAGLLLSDGPPLDPLGIFDIESKEYSPDFAPGDALHFDIRVNAVVRRRDEAGRVQKHDVAMDALRRSRRDGGEDPRDVVMDTAVLDWFARQGVRHGYEVEQDAVALMGAEQRRLGKPRSKSAVQFTEFDIRGLLRVVDPIKFGTMLGLGMGAARAYGCGLMLVRRA